MTTKIERKQRGDDEIRYGTECEADIDLEVPAQFTRSVALGADSRTDLRASY